MENTSNSPKTENQGEIENLKNFVKWLYITIGFMILGLLAFTAKLALASDKPILMSFYLISFFILGSMCIFLINDRFRRGRRMAELEKENRQLSLMENMVKRLTMHMRNTVSYARDENAPLNNVPFGDIKTMLSSVAKAAKKAGFGRVLENLKEIATDVLSVCNEGDNTSNDDQ